MKTPVKSFLILMAPAILSACATASGPTFTEAAPVVSDKGDVYLYRTAAIYAVAQSFSVMLDDQKVGDLYNESYIWMRLSPGFHTVKVVPGGIAQSSEVQIKSEGGKSSFYQYAFQTGLLANALFIGSEVKQRDEATAIAELKALKLANAQPNVPVTSFRLGAYAAIDDVNSVPDLSEQGREGYRKWLTKKYPRAFVIAEKGAWNSSWGTTTSDPAAAKDPSERAMTNCQKRGLKACKLYAVDGNVVWNPEK